jgi:hypothetical protein
MKFLGGGWGDQDRIVHHRRRVRDNKKEKSLAMPAMMSCMFGVVNKNP